MAIIVHLDSHRQIFYRSNMSFIKQLINLEVIQYICVLDPLLLIILRNYCNPYYAYHKN